MPWISDSLCQLLAPGHVLIVQPDGLELRQASSIAQLIGVLAPYCDETTCSFAVTSAQQSISGRLSPTISVIRVPESDDWFTTAANVRLAPIIHTTDWLHIVVSGTAPLTVWWRMEQKPQIVEDALTNTFMG